MVWVDVSNLLVDERNSKLENRNSRFPNDHLLTDGRTQTERQKKNKILGMQYFISTKVYQYVQKLQSGVAISKKYEMHHQPMRSMYHRCCLSWSLEEISTSSKITILERTRNLLVLGGGTTSEEAGARTMHYNRRDQCCFFLIFFLLLLV